MGRILVFFVLFFSVFSFLGAAFAVTPPEYEFSEIVVTASAEPGELKNTPATMQIVTRAQLEATGAATLDRALDRIVPSHVRIQPGAYSSQAMRGIQSSPSAGANISERVLVLVDGHRAGTGNLSFIPLVNIERVEVLRGPMSALYGGSAMGGVINVITRRGQGDFSGSAGASYGEYNKSSLDAGISGGLANDRWGYSLGARISGSSDYNDGDSHLYKDSYYRNAGGSASLVFRPSEGNSLALVGMYDRVFNTGSPPDDPAGPWGSQVKNIYGYTALEFESLLANQIRLQASLYGNKKDYEILSAANPAWFMPASRYEYKAEELGGRFLGTLPLFGISRLSLGLDYAHVWDKNFKSAKESQPDAEYDVLGLFGEHRFSLNKLSFHYGLRYDLYRAKTKDSGGLGGINAGTKTFDQLSFNTGATWWALDWLGIKAALGSAYVPPAARERVGEYSNIWGTRYIGNPDLKAEKSITGEIGLEIEYGKFSGSLAYFHTRYTDRIVTVPHPAIAWANTFKNITEQRLSGFNFAARYTHAFEVDGKKSLTLTPYLTAEVFTRRDNRKDIAGSEDTRTTKYVPAYSAVAGLGLGYGIFCMDLNARLTGAQLQDRYNYTLWQNEERNVPHYAVYNARFTVTPVEMLDVFIDVENLTNKQYAYTLGYPMPGRVFSLGLRYSF